MEHPILFTGEMVRGYSWASNPEVAAITFRHIDGNETANVAEEER